MTDFTKYGTTKNQDKKITRVETPEPTVSTSGFEKYGSPKVPVNNVNTPAPVQKEAGLGERIAAGLLKTPARLATNFVNAGQLATGKPLTHPFSGEFLGDVTPIGNTGKGFVTDIKDSIGAGTELGSYLIGGPEAKAGIQAVKEGSLLARPAVSTFMKAGKATAPAFATNSLGTSLQDTDKNIGENLLDTATGYATGYGLGGALGLGGKVLEKSGIPGKIFNAVPERVKNKTVEVANKAQDHINNVIEMGKDVLGTGIKTVDGKKIPTGKGLSGVEKTDQTLFKGSKALPSEDDIRRGTAVAKYITPGAKSTQAEAQLTQAGKEFANNTMKPFLKENASPVNFKEVYDYMHNTGKPTNISKDPVSNEAFTNTVNEAIDLITSKSSTGKRDFYNGFDVNEARKSLDKLAKDEQGVYDVGSPRNKGAKAAIDAVRTRINQLNEDSIKYGNISGVNKAQRAFNDFKQRGVRLEGTTDEQLMDQLLKENGVQSTPEREKLADTFRQYLQHQKDILEFRNNLKVRNTENIGPSGRGPSKIKEFLESNPITSKIIQNPKASLGGVGALGTIYAIGKK